ncbi:MAG: hypothetical protein HY682_01615 [Chloroflexi bacterium]|nr:hypothetical protein [Chloroflexota bacterium]
MIAENRATPMSPVRDQLARTWESCRRALLLLALVSTGIARAVMTVSNEFFTNTAGALGTPAGPNPRLRAVFAWPFRKIGRLLTPAEGAFRRLDQAVLRML